MADDSSSNASRPDNFLYKFIESYTQNNRTNLFIGIVSIVLLPFLAFFILAFDKIVQERKSLNPSYNWPEYSDLSTALLSCAVLVLLNLVARWCFLERAKAMVNPKYQNVRSVDVAERILMNFIKILYVCFASIFAYYIAIDAPFFPRSLGGSGATSEMYRGYPYQEPPPLLRTYLMIQMGFMANNWFFLLWDKPKHDFMENFLHHILSISLLMTGYFMNHVNPSLLILLCHDLSDIFVHFSRLLFDTNRLAVLSFFMLVAVWIYFRLYVFPFEVIAYVIYWNPFYQEIHGFEVISLMLHTLLALHLYWFFLIIRVGYRFFLENKIDKQQDS